MKRNELVGELMEILSMYDLDELADAVEDRVNDYYDWAAHYEGDGENCCYSSGFGQRLIDALNLLIHLNSIKKRLDEAK